jgi:hypothetical protein
MSNNVSQFFRGTPSLVARIILEGLLFLWILSTINVPHFMQNPPLYYNHEGISSALEKMLEFYNYSVELEEAVIQIIIIITSTYNYDQ